MNIFHALIFSCLLHFQVSPQGKQIQDAFLREDSSLFIQMMSDRVSIGIEGNIQNCSKKQAEIILKRFFTKHKTEAFYFIGSDKSMQQNGFYKAKLVTEKQNYIVSISLIDFKEKKQIHRLTIQKNP